MKGFFIDGMMTHSDGTSKELTFFIIAEDRAQARESAKQVSNKDCVQGKKKTPFFLSLSMRSLREIPNIITVHGNGQQA